MSRVLHPLEADLREVLADIRHCGVALEPALAHELEVDHWRQWATFEIGDLTIGIRRALDFWFLLGDANHQQSTSRLVDASTWSPDGSAYDGEPADLADARARRAARCVLRLLPPEAVPPALSIDPRALRAFTLDLRYT